MKRFAILAMLVVACGAPAASPSPSGHGITGSLILRSTSVRVTDGACHGTGGYDDIREGATVTIRNQSEEVIATGFLSANVATSKAGQCGFTFAIGVPAATFYTIEVSHRGEVTYSLDDLEASGWAPTLTLGSD